MEPQFNGVKVFSATKFEERRTLGEAITKWLAENKVMILGKEVRQSSDSEFHCLSIILFFLRHP